MVNPNVFTIPASAPFLPTLIRALIDGRLVPGYPADGGPLALAGATLYLPTRRACRLARDLFLAAIERDAAILPRILPIGDIDEDEFAFVDSAAGMVAESVLDLPPALGEFHRRVLLARLISRWAGQPSLAGSGGAPLVAGNPAAALALAENLARLIDDMTTRQIAWNRLDELVPDHLDRYWQLTLDFLKIAREQWPEILKERGSIEAAARRDRLIAAEAVRLATVAERDGPIIAAGSTGSMPATAMLLATIARLPRGAVVLPGLDTDLDPPAWRLICGQDGADDIAPAIGHPQFAMRALLVRLQIDREAVIRLAEPAAGGRERLVSEAMRPSDATECWSERRAIEGAPTLADVSMIEAANAEEEALAIAIALREGLEDPQARPALITPDRVLARRVVAALGRWQVVADDSAGEPLSETPAALFARLIADVALGGVPPVALLALLKHPLFRLGAAAGAHDRTIAVLERAILRGPRPRPGTAGLAHALATLRRARPKLHRSDPRRLLSEAELALAADLVARLAAALAPLESLTAQPQRFGEIARRHRNVVAALAHAALSTEDAAALGQALDDITAVPPQDDLEVVPADYPDLFRAVLHTRMVRGADEPGRRVRIFGPLEARLQPLDRVVLGGLVEGSWPPETRTDPWLSRPMRRQLGLDLPERRIGLSAHDFAQTLGAREIIMSRAAKVGGVPTIASRFVQRLEAVAGADQWTAAVARGERYLALARRLDRPERVAPIASPVPAPAVALRPTALRVTEIEDWLRDPYTIYARHVLRLRPLDPIDTPPGAADRGTAIHGAIGDFTKDFAKQLPLDSLEELLWRGRKSFEPLEDFPEARAFWWPRFERIARWFAVWETRRRSLLRAVHAEIAGEIRIPFGEGELKLLTRADRIELEPDGRYAILDYKTGQTPTERQVRLGLSPQLTLEAAILRAGGFPDIPAGASVAALTYVALKGGEPAGRDCPIVFTTGTPDQQADKALARLRDLAARFADPTQPYRSLVSPMWATRYGDYDHLARVKEWSAVAETLDA